MERIRPSELDGDELWKRNGWYVSEDAYQELRAALITISNVGGGEAQRVALEALRKCDNAVMTAVDEDVEF